MIFVGVCFCVVMAFISLIFAHRLLSSYIIIKISFILLFEFDIRVTGVAGVYSVESLNTWVYQLGVKPF